MGTLISYCKEGKCNSISVLLPRDRFQGIDHMTGVDYRWFIFNLHTVNSIFMFHTTTKIINYLGITSCAVREKPAYFEDRYLAHGGKFPSTQVPCLKPTALTLTFQTPLALTNRL
jgi:hypothetical protein